MKSSILGLELYEPSSGMDFRGEIYTTWSNKEHRGVNYPELNFCHDKFSRSQKQITGTSTADARERSRCPIGRRLVPLQAGIRR